MSSAAARAEARRKAILSRGGDRLAKLTSSARGEDASAYLNEDQPLAPSLNITNVETFIGEQSDLPTPPAATSNARASRIPRPSHTASPRATMSSSPRMQQSADAQPSPAQEEQLRQLQEILSGVGASPSLPQLGEDPFAAMMSSLVQPGNMPRIPAEKAAMVKPKSRLQKMIPLIHLLAAWALLAYFVLWKEPEQYELQTHDATSENFWGRWAELGWKSPGEGWGVQTVPFFWALSALALVLHSWRILSKTNTPQPPMLLALALPHLPPPIPSIITNGMAYLQIGNIFLDDIAALLVGIGLLIWVAGWLAV